MYLWKENSPIFYKKNKKIAKMLEVLKMIVPKMITINLTDGQRKDLEVLFREFPDIKRQYLYEAIINHGMYAIFTKYRWERPSEVS